MTERYVEGLRGTDAHYGISRVTKRCSRCGETKSIDDFGKSRNAPDGHAHWCKECRKDQYHKDKQKEGFLEGRAAYREANRGRQRAYMKRYWAANKDDLNQQIYALKKANPEKYAELRRQRDRRMGSGHRARAKRYGVIYTPINKIAIFERDGWICGLCDAPVDKAIPWPDLECATLDHIIPMSRGGDHVESNVHLAHYFCNLLKQVSGNEV